MKITIMVMSMLLLLSLGGCVHAQMVRDLDKKLNENRDSPKQTGLDTLAKDEIVRNHLLTAAQKVDLFALQQQTQRLLNGYDSTAFKLRGILIKDISQAPYNQFEVAEIEDRLADIQRKSLNVFVDAVAEARAIVGNNSTDNSWLVKTFGLQRPE